MMPSIWYQASSTPLDATAPASSFIPMLTSPTTAVSRPSRSNTLNPRTSRSQGLQTRWFVTVGAIALSRRR